MSDRIALGAIVALLLPVVALRSEAGSEPLASAVPSPLTLDWCLERAHDASPALERAAALSAAASHRVKPAGAFDDPRFEYEASNLPVDDFQFDRTPLSGHQLRLRQRLPFPGLLSSRRGAARQGAAATALLLADQRAVTDGAVEAAFAELAFAQRAHAITDRNIALLRQLAAAAESKYRVGTALQQDVLRAQVELTALLQSRLRRTEAIDVAEAQLVELLDLPGQTRLPPATGLAVSSPEPSLEPLLGSLVERSPRLRASESRVEAARLRVRAAELEGLPDVDVGVGYRIRRDNRGDPVNGEDFFSAGVTIRLPVDRAKWRERVAEASAELRRAEAERRAERAALVSLARRAHAELTRATSEEALLATGLVPQALQSLESSRSAYEVGSIEFLGVLDSQVRLLDAELRLERARADRRLGFAALEASVGEKLR